MRIVKLVVALLGIAAAAPAVAQEAFKVVANPDVSVESLSRAQLSDIFLKRATTWPDGARVVPVDLTEENKAAEAFSQAVHGKPVSLIRAFWRRVAMSGRDTPPPTRASDAEVLGFVRTTRGAVGYVSGSADTTGMKVIRVGK